MVRVVGFTLVVLALGFQFPKLHAEEVDWGKPVDGLQLGISNTTRKGENLSFDIRIRNSNSKGILLNGGTMLGNGQQMWESLTVELEDAGGTKLPIVLHWRVAGGAGRIYFLGLPLRQGSIHTISISDKDYMIRNGVTLAAGKYRLECNYTGEKTSKYRDLTQLPDCWEGKLESNIMNFEIEK